MATDKFGIYVHIPFCKRKCNYCDFCSVSADDELVKKYTKALIFEIKAFRAKHGVLYVDTVYFGGGTPSILPIELFSDIISEVKKSFCLSENAEITLELNPGTASKDKLLKYRELGVNRLSIGVQSVHENELKKLGRIHTAAEFYKCFQYARQAGFDNINVDLMYGIPEQTKESFEYTLREIIKLQPEHISAYGLIVEEGTPFFEWRESLKLPTEDEECDMYYSADELLSSYGYLHYEISNYSKRGYSSRHNLKYWKCEEYIGFGLGAHSFFLGDRFSNTVRFSEYFSSEMENYVTKDKRSDIDLEKEYIMLSLRLSEGLDLKDYERKFSKSFLEGHSDLIDKYVKMHLMQVSDGKVSLTAKGFYLSNTVISSLI